MKLSDHRSTPQELYDELNKEFNFEVDVCASPENAKHQNYFHFGKDGLKQEWAPMRCFMNPPFSELKQWLRKARREADKGALVICILPNDSSTKWFHEYIWDKEKRAFRVPVIFPDKRYSFGDYSNVSKFAVLIAIFKELK